MKKKKILAQVLHPNHPSLYNFELKQWSSKNKKNSDQRELFDDEREHNACINYKNKRQVWTYK
jgi:hypothetical protein